MKYSAKRFAAKIQEILFSRRTPQNLYIRPPPEFDSHLWIKLLHQRYSLRKIKYFRLIVDISVTNWMDSLRRKVAVTLLYLYVMTSRFSRALKYRVLLSLPRLDFGIISLHHFSHSVVLSKLSKRASIPIFCIPLLPIWTRPFVDDCSRIQEFPISCVSGVCVSLRDD